ncbi:LytTR family DNA-binding domain-containing protein [Sediminibacterium sp.]|uniref:LytR/AlgR family response regulator transcription factor n=1 Tax=Sediminibacterium sp. TaxID=1917865 RepID=UPI00271BAB4D|nr:response regulator transcription factor [Sediminibacterium sp.]MDO9000437.1 response regulator transcription factor [Bacteroidota bacterium]MDP3146995.1 response regulator transcription factor [Bacteroidota bacterium]MDP3567468.1 response regulator transcription factor [Sediminibacterium sp.]
MTSKITAIIVDDEERALDVLSNLLHSFCPNVEIISKFNNLKDAVEVIKSKKPDLVFLDIEMPNYSGYEIVNFFDKINFEIIFVTAYDQYAIKAFECSAVDYLLKPVEIPRLKSAIDKVGERLLDKKQIANYSVLLDSLKSKNINNIVVTDKGNQCIVPTSEIIAIEAQEAYSIIHTNFKKYTVSKNLKHFEKLLIDNKNFFRAHKSWLIDIKAVDNYNRSTGEIGLKHSIKAKLSKYRKEDFEKALAS